MTLDDLRPASRLDIAGVAALLSEPARVSIVSALMDGQARPATELARIARVSPSTGASTWRS
jgi:DNA-binding transcriptional ArsR family regulator